LFNADSVESSEKVAEGAAEGVAEKGEGVDGSTEQVIACASQPAAVRLLPPTLRFGLSGGYFTSLSSW
jgi:hypothetical protein